MGAKIQKDQHYTNELWARIQFKHNLATGEHETANTLHWFFGFFTLCAHCSESVILHLANSHKQQKKPPKINKLDKRLMGVLSSIIDILVFYGYEIQCCFFGERGLSCKKEDSANIKCICFFPKRGNGKNDLITKHQERSSFECFLPWLKSGALHCISLPFNWPHSQLMKNKSSMSRSSATKTTTKKR